MIYNLKRFFIFGSIFFLVVGMAMTGGFFGRRYLERQTQLKVMARFEEKLRSDHQLDNDHAYTGSYTSRLMPADGETIAILSLDRLGIKVSIAQGIDKDTLRISAGKFPQSADAGFGNFAIAGHSSRLYVCLFNDLHRAEIGDVIYVDTKTGRHKYLVSEIRTIEPEDTSVLDPTKESILSIISCTNDGAQRLYIKGIEVET